MNPPPKSIFKSRTAVRLLSPIRASSGNVLLSAGSVVKIVAVSDSGDEFCVEHSEEIGGWPGERNRRWVSRMHTEQVNTKELVKVKDAATGRPVRVARYKLAARPLTSDL